LDLWLHEFSPQDFLKDDQSHTSLPS
jgi:hypothetical protein